MDSISADYLKTTTRRLRYYKDLGDKSFAQISDAEFHYRPDPEANSIAVLIRHLAGNMRSRWTNFLTEDGEKSWRDRDGEFAERPATRDELVAEWEQGWSCFLGALEALAPQDLAREVKIRGEALTALDAISRQLAHVPYHVGQIVFLARLLRKDAWRSLSIQKGGSAQYNSGAQVKDPAKRY